MFLKHLLGERQDDIQKPIEVVLGFLGRIVSPQEVIAIHHALGRRSLNAAHKLTAGSEPEDRSSECRLSEPTVWGGDGVCLVGR